MTARTPSEIHKKFAMLRTSCDPRGADLLDELERLSLYENALLTLHERIQHSDFSLPDVDGYPIGSAKYEALRLVEDR